MIARLPRWALYGGVVLAFGAGMINTVGYLGFHHQAVTHMTGTMTLFGAMVLGLNLAGMVYFGTLLLAFVAGCALSGFIIGDSALKLGHRYGVALAIESVLLFGAVPLLWQEGDAGLWLAAAAAGLQNAMAATYSGAVVRTGHMSGIITDLGAFLGQWLRGCAVDARRVRLYVSLFAGFLAGSLGGAAAYTVLHESTLLVPAALTGLAAIAYSIRRRGQRA